MLKTLRKLSSPRRESATKLETDDREAWQDEEEGQSTNVNPGDTDVEPEVALNTSTITTAIDTKVYPVMVRVEGAQDVNVKGGNMNMLALLTVHEHDSPDSTEQLFLFKTNTVKSTNSPDW
jgi:hypothetical protein